MVFKNVEFSDKAESDKLYMAILTNNSAEVERLRAEGFVLSDHIKGMLKTGGGRIVDFNEYGIDWYDYTMCLSMLSPDEAISVIQNFRRELGEPLYYSDSTIGIQRYYRPDVFKCILECFDNKKMSKMRDLKKIVDLNRPEMLKTAAEHGWLKLSRQREALIEYSREKNCPECTAWLLDFKNRTVDVAAERARAEKRQNAELNAAPDSVTALKGLWNYKKREDGTLAITKYKGTQTEIVIPEMIGKSPVTAIGAELDKWGNPKNPFFLLGTREHITKVIIHGGITSIGAQTFCGFYELEELNIPDSVTFIGSRAFIECKKLKRIILPDSVNEIGEYAFYGCTELKEINIPRGITKLNSYVFYECKKLRKIDIPHGVTEILNETFSNCEKLRSVEIPDTVQSIGEFAFYGCKSLESVTVPNGVSEIRGCTFYGCDNLTRVELPDTIVKIGKSAFTGCPALKEIVIPEGVREICETAFAGCAALERVVLPASLEKAKNYTQKGVEPRTIFYNSPNVTAVVTPKSYAEKYCKRNGIPFVYTEN